MLQLSSHQRLIFHTIIILAHVNNLIFLTNIIDIKHHLNIGILKYYLEVKFSIDTHLLALISIIYDHSSKLF